MERRDPADFRALLDDGIARSSKRLGVRINKVFIRTMRTKWASCSPRRNMTVNRLLSHLPERHLRYVVFHEIAHLIEKRHNDRFWRLVSRRFKNHRAIEADLFAYWFVLHRRNRLTCGAG